MAESERVRDRASLPGWPAATWCGRAGSLPSSAHTTRRSGIAQPGGVEDAHSCMMPYAATPTRRLTSPDTEDSAVFPLAERLTPRPWS